MRDRLGPGTTLSYCTNVHPGSTLDRSRSQLTRHAAEVKHRVCPNARMGVGLWVPGGLGPSAAERKSYRAFLEHAGFEATTINAFPYHDFHEATVKHRVYTPDWSTRERSEQTHEAVGLALALSPRALSLSISTLPIGWGHTHNAPSRRRGAADRLRSITAELAEIAATRGCSISVDLEPEPGCELDTCDDVIAFFDEHLPDPVHRAHIGVCHDVCHAAVMFEDQREVLRRYADAGIRVNKVQISSALDVDVGALGHEAAIDRLRAFAEPRYLHQTGFMGDGQFELIEDLPEAIERLESGDRPDRLRVHFHVPIYLDAIGDLGTTQDQILDAVLAAREFHDTKHFEVETYAWGVLPDEHKRETLAEGIADELLWVLDTVAPAACEIEPVR